MEKRKLVELFEEVMNKGLAKKLAEKIIHKRKFQPFQKVGDLVKIVESIPGFKKKPIHPATLPFMALRMGVNSELENLSEGLAKAYKILGLNGRLVVIS